MAVYDFGSDFSFLWTGLEPRGFAVAREARTLASSIESDSPSTFIRERRD
ncbi:hypothetical protein [Halalkalicoccus ordinarius]